MQEKNRRYRRLSLIFFSVAAVLALAASVLARLDALRSHPLDAFSTPSPLLGTAAPSPSPQAAALYADHRVSAADPNAYPAAQVFGNNTINIVLMGIDSNEEREKKGRGYRSDTIAVLVIDPDTPSCMVINVPRDTRAKVRRLSDSGRVTATMYNKINSAFEFGGGPNKHGAENLLASLDDLLTDDLPGDLSLTYYACIDMEGIAKFADAVDGVPVKLSTDVPGFGKKGDTVVLKGEQAQAFVRKRHGVTGGSDLARIKRQQAFIRAFASRVKGMGARQAVPRLWASLSSSVRTNLSVGQMLALADVLNRLDMSGVQFMTLPGHCKTIDRRSYYVPDSAKIRALALELWGAKE